jgi:aryl-alcohol dehydrogenase-like predicted oxidoreductase
MTEKDYGLSRAQIHKQIDASLKRLNTEYVDLYQCHRYDESTPLEETMQALTEVVREGKTRYIGFSEWKADQIRASLSIPNVEKFVSSQPQYSMIWRVPEEEVFPISAANGISQIVWSPLAQGVLTGKYLPGSPPPAHSRAVSPEMNTFMDPDLMSDQTLSAVQKLKPIAKSLGLTLAQLALAWVLRRSEVASAIIGASRPSQLDENVAASGIKLSAETLQAIDRIALPVQRFSASTN